MEKTTLYFTSNVIPEDVVELFTNRDGSKPLGNVIFPRTPVVVPGSGSGVSRVVEANFTTREEFVENPPSDFVVLGEEELNSANLAMLLDRFSWATYNSIMRFVYTIYNDGVLVWGWMWNWG